MNQISYSFRHGICVVDMVDNLDSADSNRFSTAVERLKSRSDAPVVVVIAEMAAVRGLLQAIQNQGVYLFRRRIILQNIG